MPERIPDAEPLKLRIPESLTPSETGPKFPVLTIESLRELAQAGWERIGVIVLVINNEGEVLTVTHGAGNPKVPSGTMGVLMETLTFNSERAEQVDDGISRVFAEELGLSEIEIQALDLQTVEHGAWSTVTFPLGPGKDALGLVVVLRADAHTADAMIRRDTGFTPTEEIRYASYTRLEPLAMNSPLASIFRTGTPGVVQAGMDLLTTPQRHVRLTLPAPKQKRPEAQENIKDLLSS